MAEYCGDLVDLQDRGLSSLHLLLTDQEVYRRHMSCFFAVRAPPDHRLTLTLRWLDIAVGRFSSCADYLSVWDGAFNKTSHVEGEFKSTQGKGECLCGTGPSTRPATSTVSSSPLRVKVSVRVGRGLQQDQLRQR